MKILFHNVFQIIFVVAALVSLVSCSNDDEIGMQQILDEEDDCPNIVEKGPYYMEESVLDFFPYSETTNKIVFSDSLGQEYEGIITENDFSVQSGILTFDFECEEDSTETYNLSIFVSRWNIDFQIEELDLFLKCGISVQALPAFEFNFDLGELEAVSDSIYVKDLLSIYLLHPEPYGIADGWLNVVINPRTSSVEESTPIDSSSYLIHGKEFKDVFIGKDFSEDCNFKLVYNTTFGLIGIENEDKSISLKFERWE